MNIVRFGQRSVKVCLAILLSSLFVLNCALSAKGMTSSEDSSIGKFHVSGRYLVDPYGDHFLIRGVSVPHAWYPTRTSAALANIKAKGANTVRIVLSSGQRWTKSSASDVANVIRLCRTNKLICILEVHDTTGYGEQSGAASLAQAVAYWKGIKSALMGQEAYVLINLGNEPYGNNNPTSWIDATKSAIAEMRNAGFQHTLVVDAPNWGQDSLFIMRDNAASVLASDPLGNTVFSIHMFGVFDTAQEVEDYLSAFVNANLPLIIGEFGYLHTDGNPDEDAIMAKARTYEIGYLGWSWSGNSDPVKYLDMVTNFDSNQETWWGTRIFHGTDGILETSKEAAVYPVTTFADVPFSNPYWQDIEILYANGLTGGCATSPLKYCPDQTMNRGAAAVFILRANFGPSYVSPVPTHIFKDDWTKGPWAETWAEGMYYEGLSGGCQTSPPKYCPWAEIPREQAVIFVLRMKYGSLYTPPVATGTLFADMTNPSYYATSWAEQAYNDGLIPNCGTSGGKPKFCPKDLVSRGLGAYMIVRAKNLTVPGAGLTPIERISSIQ